MRSAACSARASYALFHLVTVFPLSWITLYTPRPIGDFLILQMIGAVLLAVGVVVSGLLADRFGRRNTLGAMAALIALFACAMPFLLDGADQPGDIGRERRAGVTDLAREIVGDGASGLAIRQTKQREADQDEDVLAGRAAVEQERHGAGKQGDQRLAKAAEERDASISAGR